MTSRNDRRNRRIERRRVRLTKAAEKLVDWFGPRITATEAVGELNFVPDGPVCTGAQKGYVHQAVKAAMAQEILAKEPDLTEELTIGQAEGILMALGADPDALHRRGRALGAAKEQRAWRFERRSR
jgi:hypothetical protein